MRENPDGNGSSASSLQEQVAIQNGKQPPKPKTWPDHGLNYNPRDNKQRSIPTRGHASD